jgi:heme oxygenase
VQFFIPIEETLMVNSQASPALSPTNGFVTRLREHTNAAHRKAESATFMTDLLGGHGSAQLYATLLGQYYFVYDALERVGERFRDHPVGRLFVDDALLRRRPIEADLTHFWGKGWRGSLNAVGATRNYVDRLENVASRGSELFVAHHYTRYLGDLSGGRIIKTLIQRHYAIPDDGVTFFDFPGIPKAVQYKDAYRAALQAGAWTENERTALVNEVGVAYELNGALFDELAACDRQ